MLLHISNPALLSHHTSRLLSSIDNKCIQPNATDLRVQKISKLTYTTFELQEESKINRDRYEVHPDSEGFYILSDGAYEIVLGQIRIGGDEAGWVIPRSTLIRNGINITTGLYDSGYQGDICACMHVASGLFKLQKNTRLAQFILVKAQALYQYNGQYQNGGT